MIEDSNQKGFSLIELLISLSIIGILSTGVVGSLNSTRSLSRDSVRISDVRQIAIAMELNRSIYDDDYSVVSATLPGSIGIDLPVVPENNMVNDGQYFWMDNTSRPDEYCIWAEIENDTYGHLYFANPYGRGYQDEAPTTFEECRFYRDEHTVNNNNGGDDVIELCHFPAGNPNKQKTIIVPDDEVDGHLNNHVGDHLGTCLNEGGKGRGNN